jgi:hypothetical protein
VVLVGLTGTDDPVVVPHRNPSVLPLLDHIGIVLLDDLSNPGKGLAPPITQLLDPLSDPRSGRFSSLSFFEPAVALVALAVAFFPLAVFFFALVLEFVDLLFPLVMVSVAFVMVVVARVAVNGTGGAHANVTSSIIRSPLRVRG